MHVQTLFVSMLLMPAAAQAFCGAYVGPPGTQVTNEASEVVMARSNGQTVLTLINDYTASVSDFALVIPVPEPLIPSQVGTVPVETIDRLRGWSAPREVAYTCADLYGIGRAPNVPRVQLSCSSKDSDSDTLDNGYYQDDGYWGADVEVVSSFSVSEYDIEVLRADGGLGLQAWLDAHGYGVPPGGAAILQTYIDSGSYFLAAKVALDRAPPSPEWMSPLQFRYESAVWSLPLRIGTISSSGTQNLVVYALNEGNTEAGISNYPELTIEDECMLPEGADMGEHLEAQVEKAFADADGAAWMVEHSWDIYSTSGGPHCDPCTTVSSVPESDLYSLGLGVRFDDEGDTGGFGGGWSVTQAHLTRMRLIYRPDQITEDLLLYNTGRSAQQQLRYIRYDESLESALPVCGLGFVDDPGRCEMPEVVAAGCASIPRPLGGIGGLLLATVLLRRRRSAVLGAALALWLTPAVAIAAPDDVQVTAEAAQSARRVTSNDAAFGSRADTLSEGQGGGGLDLLWRRSPTFATGVGGGVRHWRGGLDLGNPLRMRANQLRLEYLVHSETPIGRGVVGYATTGVGVQVTRFTLRAIDGGLYTWAPRASQTVGLQVGGDMAWLVGGQLTLAVPFARLNGYALDPATTDSAAWEFNPTAPTVSLVSGVRF